jgi:hypothetical protein
MNSLIRRVFARHCKPSLCHVILAVAFFTAATNADAQVQSVTLNPPSPTTMTSVSILVSAYFPCTDPSLVRAGNTFSVVIPYNCEPVEPLAWNKAFQLGYLQPGEYFYEVHNGDGFVVAAESFVVADAGAPFIPTLSPLSLAVTALALAAAGALSLRLLS